MVALLWRTCLLTAAGSGLTLRAPSSLRRSSLLVEGLRAAPSRFSPSRLLMTGQIADKEDKAARSARLREKLEQLKADQAARAPPPPEVKEMRLDDMTHADWTLLANELAPFMKDNRVGKLIEVLDKRRGGLHIVLENIADPHNAAAVLRTSEGLGIQHVHVIESVCEFHIPSANALASGRGSLGNVAMGASRWLTVSRYRSSAACYHRLRELGVQIFSSDCPPLMDGNEDGDEQKPTDQGLAWLTEKPGRDFDAKSIEDLDWHAAPSTALVFGNERRGVSKAFIDASDASFFLPMCGFTQSFNISVAAAMSLWSAIASGAFPEGSLSKEEKAKLFALWLLRDIKAAKPILRNAGIELVDF